MQASLDLANAGYKVYLVEKGPAIGGVMAQLDKTFPTNDCAMCTLAPRMVECGNHLNIEKLTYSEVEDITGEPGAFKARIRKKARSVDASKCTGCGTCMRGCPVQNKVRIPEPAKVVETKETIEAEKIVKSYGYNRQYVIQILQEANDRFNYLPEGVLKSISRQLEMPYAEVYGIASFYKSLRLEPRGQHVIQVCMGTACHVRGAPRVLEEFQRRLDIDEGRTTSDGLFTLETVNCIGACALGPVVVIDGEYHGEMTPSKVPRVIDCYQPTGREVVA
ncbi:MAG: NAD(P)H-dependent oxidoreductase subunit E [Chitinispirillaceae bacterium]|nr:NAD(P)H-dependent oxidoreductase subunit E [Chitinispirillaceae bacterium]